MAGLASYNGAIALAQTTPFGGTPIALPGTIQAANFDDGWEGVAYHDTTSGNTGGAYRATDVDIQVSSEGGYNIGWIDPGEWVNYTVSVPAAGDYIATLRVASPVAGGSLHIGFNGPGSVWKTVTIPTTGDWQAWTSVAVPVTLGAGVQQMTLLFDTGAVNISSVVVTAAGSQTSSAGLAPFSGTPVTVPGLVLAANFDNGGEGVAYHDTTAGNSGGAYRMTDVDIEPASDGGYDVAWTGAGEWLNYTVNVASAGTYAVNLRVASAGGGSMHVGFNNASNVWRVVSIPNTGDWQSWTVVSFTASLGAGTQQMTVLFDTGGINIESIGIASPGPLPPTSTGGVIAVTAGGDLQAAIDNAQPGDTIVLQAGVTFTGNFVLPAKSGSAYVTITSSGNRSGLPGDNTRIDPSYSPLLAKIQSPNSNPAIATAPFAHHYQLQLLEFLPTFQGLYDIIELGDGNQNSLDVVPHDLVLDRVYIHGDPTFGQKRGIALNSASTTIKNSYIAGIVGANMDTQAICGWNGPGPFTIANNYLEASGENLLFGGMDPAVPNLVPSDIAITHNQLSKLWAWRGQAWAVKNLLEFKNAQRVVVDGNILENNWEAGQDYAVQFTPRNQDGTAPWTVVQQIQFTNNIVRHVAAAIAILGSDDNAPSQQTNAITIRNNLFEDVSSARYGGNGWFLVTLGASDVTVDHNTIFADGSSDLYADAAPSPGFVFTNNIMQNNAWAIMGNGASPGNGTIAAFFPGSWFLGSVIAGANPATYPGGNFYPANLDAVGFINLGGGNYRLSTSSPYLRSATDGADVGASIDAINAAAGTQY
jgi:carbohydrate binding protein with CBM6 domain